MIKVFFVRRKGYRRYKKATRLSRVKWFMVGLMVGLCGLLVVYLFLPYVIEEFIEKIEGNTSAYQEVDVLVTPALQVVDVVPEAEIIDIEGIEILMLDLVNYIRSTTGVKSPLVWDVNLYSLAQEHSQWMVDTGNFEHSRYNVWECVLFYPNYGDSNSEIAGELIASWMRSPRHRAILLEPSLSHAGIGVVRSGGALYATFCAE